MTYQLYLSIYIQPNTEILPLSLTFISQSPPSAISIVDAGTPNAVLYLLLLIFQSLLISLVKSFDHKKIRRK